MKTRIAALASVAALLVTVCSAADAPAPYAKVVGEGMKIVSFNAKTCRKSYVFTFKIEGSGKHTYRYVLSNGSGQGGGSITLTQGRRAGLQKQVGWTLGTAAKNGGGTDIWLGVAFDGGAETHMSTYHDTCQKP
jgi:hypothetical protein